MKWSRSQLRTSALGADYSRRSSQSLYVVIPMQFGLACQHRLQLTALVHLRHDV